MAGEGQVRGKRLLVRADANLEIGTGHVMRCLALSQAWQDQGGDVTFAMRQPEASIRQRLESEKIRVEEVRDADDARECAEAGKRLKAAWVVVDGYGFGSDYQKTIQAAGFPVLFVDDYGHSGEYTAELVLNQNISADEAWYARRSATTRLLLGTDFAMLRREFRARSRRRNTFPEQAHNLLITMGGADKENVSGTALSAVGQVNLLDAAVKVVVGVANPHESQLRETIARRGLAAEIVRATTQMPELMEWADLAVSATGGTVWELLYMQVPVVGISVADNQRPTMRRLSDLGLAVTMDLDELGEGGELVAAIRRLVADRATRTTMSRRGRECVDGQGVERIIGAMMEASAPG